MTAAAIEIHNNMEPMNAFLLDWHVRVTWIAWMTLYVFWGAAWFSRHAFDNSNESDLSTGVHSGTADPALDGQDVANHHKTVQPPSWSRGICNRLNRAHDMLRDQVFMLGSVLTLNTFARASTRAVMILSWIYVAFAFIMFFVEAGYKNGYVRFLYSLLFYGIGLTICGLAYRQGFHA
ncbi:hypothetical protein J3Q64DRAFT_1819612 [Phycomyces blakesleeanus]|uniref:Uncharacterized protein n=2 Tax=Phycomyces blakesleeanus TaxID=4837 RepID=A0A163BDZ0_PHYB8|nr:hypothetical protein PHYBLDRAFT_138510 [Phycomyces blakesleeanus NRRL 1555(-)]OAD80961.1 hypothetical protein PHYBLDRAFT_138510 [Phycomyces blakesleeanus NRRL 1555(-)]|eukprot:XP_018299001.1 hypothetical protein PHYBLDRAFT_138510 [Phycomyces blakesleeanus NRRL 1555(-)]